MTMINAYFTIPDRAGISIMDLQEMIADSYRTAGEVDELPEFDGRVGARKRTVKIYLHVSEMENLVETMEKGIGAELLLAW